MAYRPAQLTLSSNSKQLCFSLRSNIPLFRDLCMREVHNVDYLSDDKITG